MKTTLKTTALSAAIIVGALDGTHPAGATIINSTWKSDIDVGNWNNEDNWNGPDGAKVPWNRMVGPEYYSYAASIPADPMGGIFGGITVTLDMDPVIGNLSIGANSRINIQNRSLAVERLVTESGSGVITNQGEIKLLGSTAATYLSFVTDDTSVDNTLGGTGTVTLWGGSNLLSYVSGYRLVQESGHRIEGTGHVQLNVKLTNFGAIRASQFDTLAIDPPVITSIFRNHGLAEATGGGLLKLYGGTVDNTGGTIRAKDGSFVDFAVKVKGGTLATEGSGVIRSNSGGILGTTTITGTVMAANGKSLFFYKDPAIGGDTITNNGTISLESTGTTTTLAVLESMTLEGTGSLNLSNNSLNRIRGGGFPTAYVLGNGPNHTIQGSGSLGDSELGISNKGTIRANQSASLVVTPNSWGCQNEGVMEADGGTLRLAGGSFWNNGGLMRHKNGGLVQLFNSTVSGGSLTGSGGGSFRIADFAYAYLDNFTLSTTLTVANGTTAYFRTGTLTNNGVLSMAAAASVTYIRLSAGDVTLAGTGSLQMSNSSNNYFLGIGYSGDTQKRLTNGPAHTIQGSGNLGADTMAITNNGTLWGNQSSLLIVDPNSTGGLTNNGTLRAGPGGSLKVNDSLTNYNSTSHTLTGGRWEAISNGTASTLTLQGATITHLAADTAVLLSGAAASFPALNSLVNNAGTLAIHNKQVFSRTGDLTIGGRLQFGLTNGAADGYNATRFAINGNVNLTGLAIDVASLGLTPGLYEVMTWTGTRTGTPVLGNYPPGADVSLITGASSVIINVNSIAPIPPVILGFTYTPATNTAVITYQSQPGVVFGVQGGADLQFHDSLPNTAIGNGSVMQYSHNPPAGPSYFYRLSGN